MSNSVVCLSLILCACLTSVATAGNEAPAEVYDPEGQRQRVAAIIKEFSEARLEYFDAQGSWTGPAADKSWRDLEHSGYILPFLQSGNAKAIKLASAIAAHQSVSPKNAGYALLMFKDKLSAEAIANLEKQIKAQVTGDFQQHRWKHFQGDNDNFQLMAAAAVSMWGTYSKESRWLEDARRRLEECKELLTRRGMLSEFNSPAYLPLHLHPLALIAETTDDPALRKLAIDLETRVWLDLLGHYHPAVGLQGGPHSREYDFGLYGATFPRLHLYTLLGDKLPGDWREGYVSESREWGLVRGINRAVVPYHCPKWLVEWALNRKYPYRMIASAEGSASFEWLHTDASGNLFGWMQKGSVQSDEELYELPAWESRLVQYQTQDYSLGTTSRQFTHGIQSNSFMATMPFRTPLTSVDQAVRVHCRYVIDDHRPGDWNQKMPAWAGQIQWEMDKGYKPDWPLTPHGIRDAGRLISVQHDKTAMVLYRPRVMAYAPRSLKTSIRIPCGEFGFGKPRADEIYLGDQLVENFKAESVEPQTVYVRINDVYMAFIPLINNSLFNKQVTRPHAIQIRRENKALGISFINHQGEPLKFNPRQFTLLGGGFVCEMGAKREDGSFDAFRRRFAAKEIFIVDYYRSSVHSRNVQLRVVDYKRPGLRLQAEYNPATEGIRTQAINGRVATIPKLEATDLPIEKVPFGE
jgi:hypothetical protein